MALTVPQKMALAEITRKSYARIDARLSSLNLDSDQETYIAADITLWNANHNKLKVTLEGGSSGVNYKVKPLLDEIRMRILNGLGYSVSGIAGVYAGGISLADKTTREADTDRIVPAFTSDLHRTL